MISNANVNSSDALHAWHILQRNGINVSDIVLFAYDDIAHNPSNPTPGVMVNWPESKHNVYANVTIDYRRNQVNVRNFVAALTSINATGKALHSTDDDDVLVLFHDHGGVGILCVINEYLYADQLIKAINATKFRSMVLMVEACERYFFFILYNKSNVIQAVQCLMGCCRRIVT